MKYLGGCYSYKEKYKLKYECCGSCHEEDEGGYSSLCECRTKDGYYAVCCNYIDPTEEGEEMSRPLGIEDDDSKESVEEYKNRLQGGENNEEVEFLPAKFEDRHRISNQCSSITNHSKAILSDLSEIAEAHFILRQEYEKLLAKYNGVFYWVVGHVFEDFNTAEDVKKEYEESLK